MACATTQVAAQGIIIDGEITHGGGRRPLADQWALLFEIRGDTAGQRDSAAINAAGRYRLRLRRPDSTAVYYVVTTFQDVEYYSAELRPAKGQKAVAVAPIVVYDTTAGGPPMRVERRLLTLLRAGEHGDVASTIVDMVEVANPGTRTRIARDSLHPVWSMVLPAGAREWQPTAGNLIPQAVGIRGDTVQVFAPIWPGEPLRLSQRYALPGSPVRLRLDQATATLVVLLEDTSATLSGGTMRFAGMREAEGGRFAAYTGGPFTGGEEVLVTLSRPPLTPTRLLPYVVGVAGLAFAWALWVALTRKATAPRDVAR